MKELGPLERWLALEVEQEIREVKPEHLTAPEGGEELKTTNSSNKDGICQRDKGANWPKLGQFEKQNK